VLTCSIRLSAEKQFS